MPIAALQLSMLMRRRGCKLLIFPGAFNLTTGPAHWELLQRARAVDNQVIIFVHPSNASSELTTQEKVADCSFCWMYWQVFVAAVSPARNPASGYQVGTLQHHTPLMSFVF